MDRAFRRVGIVGVTTLSGVLSLAVSLAGQGITLQAPAPRLTYAATGLQLNYAAGRIAVGGLIQTINAGNVTVADTKTNCQAPTYASCNFIYWPATGTALLSTSSYATAFLPGYVVVGFVTSTGGNITAVTPASLNVTPTLSNKVSDGSFFVDPTSCLFTPTTTAAASGWPKLLPITTGQLVYQFKSDTTIGTITVTCLVNVPTRLTSGTGVTMTDVGLYYGVETTALTSIAAATFTSVSYPTTAGGAAAGVVAASGGSYTVTPATLQLATVTAGRVYYEKVAFGTPVTVNADSQTFVFEQVFTTAGTTATILDLGGLIVHYTNQVLP